MQQRFFRAKPPEAIEKLESEAEWADLDELNERGNLLYEIQKAENEADWSDIEELRERAALLSQIQETGPSGLISTNSVSAPRLWRRSAKPNNRNR